MTQKPTSIRAVGLDLSSYVILNTEMNLCPDPSILIAV